MLVLRFLLFGCVFAGLRASAASAQETSLQRTDAAVAKSVAQLDHAEWTVREQATQQLVRAGAPAVQVLAKCAATGSPEAALRAIEVLSTFYDQDDFPAMDVLESELEQLLSAKGSAGEAARQAWESHRAARERRAIARIQELGGRIDLSETLSIDLDEQVSPTIDHIAIGPSWKGGDDGLKLVGRLSRFSLDSKRIYRVKGAPVSEAAWQKLADAGFQVDDRGAYLGIGSKMPFGGVEDGCRIDSVKPKSPADQAGLQEDDVIVKFDNKPVKDFTELIELLKAAEPGQKALFGIKRGEQDLELTVQLGSW